LAAPEESSRQPDGAQLLQVTMWGASILGAREHKEHKDSLRSMRSIAAYQECAAVLVLMY
jgi:hypothetical protein